MFDTYNKSNYRYTANFCEENIWHLGKALMEEGIPDEDLWVLFLSNDQKRIPLFYQQASITDPVIWDYHVVLMLKHTLNDTHSSESYIFDFDSRMPFPSLLSKYTQLTFNSSLVIPPAFEVYVRQIPLKSYHQRFYSDRSHMLDEQGEPLSPFPKYDPIVTQSTQPIHIEEYWDMSRNLDDGSRVIHHEELV